MNKRAGGCYRSETERRANVQRSAWERHPDSPHLRGLLVAWSDAEARANLMSAAAGAAAEARAAMERYLRFKRRPILFPYAVLTPDQCK